MSTKKTKKRLIKKKTRGSQTRKRSMPKKRKVVRVATKKGPLILGSTTNAKNIKFKASARKGTKYQSIIDRMAGLKKGHGFTVDIPADSDPRNFHNRLNAVLHRAKVKPPQGCRFEKRTTENNNIGIRLMERKKKTK